MSVASARGALDFEAAQFAETVAAVARTHAAPDPWTPGAACSDAADALDGALADAGFGELGTEPGLLALAGPAGLELGRALTALRPLDRLLGGALVSGSVVRYPADGVPLVTVARGRLELADAVELRPVPYADALGASELRGSSALRTVEGAEAAGRMAAWIAASTGYLAGVCAAALALALEHTRSRVAFGRPLAALEPVQQTLADAATFSDGLALLAADKPGPDALAHAGGAAVEALAGCQQVTGALGFTLEFPMQRANRRARSCRAWNEAVLDAWGEP